MKTTVFVVIAASAALIATTTLATTTPEEKCQSGRYKAAAKYAACEQKANAKYAQAGAGGFTKWITAVGKCGSKYTAIWSKLQAAAAGSGATCDSSRFVDNGDGTVTDNLTNLVWEKKTNKDLVVNFSDPHDADNFYTWSTAGAAANGHIFTVFLATLNSTCFAGQCDWRLPSLEELQTILVAPFPCGSDPCIDPIFGPTNFEYVTSTDDTVEGHSDFVMTVIFGTPAPDVGRPSPQTKLDVEYGRAVRGGL